MKYYILLITLIANYTFVQQIDYNTKKGFAANGYDVVAYFNNEATEGNKKKCDCLYIMKTSSRDKYP